MRLYLYDDDIRIKAMTFKLKRAAMLLNKFE